MSWLIFWVRWLDFYAWVYYISYWCIKVTIFNFMILCHLNSIFQFFDNGSILHASASTLFIVNFFGYMVNSLWTFVGRVALCMSLGVSMWYMKITFLLFASSCFYWLFLHDVWHNLLPLYLYPLSRYRLMNFSLLLIVDAIYRSINCKHESRNNTMCFSS